MEFKKGDKVICINNKNCAKSLVLNKQYTVNECYKMDNSVIKTEQRLSFYEIDDFYYTHRFKLLSEVRKEKLKQLKNELF